MQNYSLALLFVICLYLGCKSVGKEKLNNPQQPKVLSRQLAEIDLTDQKYRLELEKILNSLDVDTLRLKEIGGKIRAADSVNQQKIWALLDSTGWPDKKLIGEEGAVTIWAVIQHSSLDQQEKYFPLLKKATDNHSLPPKYLAYTEDRILINKGLKQKYGTQLQQYAGKQAYLLPLQQPEQVDSLRNKVYLAPLSIF